MKENCLKESKKRQIEGFVREPGRGLSIPLGTTAAPGHGQQHEGKTPDGLNVLEKKEKEVALMDSPGRRAPLPLSIPGELLPPSIPLLRDGEEEIWGGEGLGIHKEEGGKERPNRQVQRTASN